jgi:hypothetical protein
MNLARPAAFLVAMLIASVQAPATPPAAPPEWDQRQTPCSTGLRIPPAGPFAVFLFCEDALGTYLAVVRLGPLGQPSAGPWTLNDRYWYEPLWGADVTGYRWSSGGYCVDLGKRHASQLLPDGPAVSNTAPGPGYFINQLKPQLGAKGGATAH